MLDGDPAHPQKGNGAPKFSDHVYCGQSIKMALGTELGLGPGHIVLDGDPAALHKREAELPIFSPFLLWPNGWMHQDATWYGGRTQPRRHCVRWGPNHQFLANVHFGQTA